MRLDRFSAVGLVVAITAWTPACLAQEAVADLPVLVVKGSSSAEDGISFDRDQLEAMGMTSIETSTPWNEGVVNFEGVPMETILAEAGVEGTTATVTALNDYSVEIPVSDFSEFGVILAIKRNGEYMPVDDQGPFFVMYPFDSDPALQGQPYHGRAVWQVKEIAVE
jgi:hypothetical protein